MLGLMAGFVSIANDNIENKNMTDETPEIFKTKRSANDMLIEAIYNTAKTFDTIADTLQCLHDAIGDHEQRIQRIEELLAI